MEKILSITIPTYNVEKYLDRCIESLTFEKSILGDLEIIIVNDGSKDNSLEIAKKYEKKYPQTVKVIDKENGGHGSTINAGLKIATGKYFRVIDSDDWVNVDDFADFVKALKKLNVDFVATDYQQEIIYENKTAPFKYDNIEYNKIYKFDELNLDELKPQYFTMHSMTYKTEVLREAKLELDEHCFYVDMEYILLPLKYVNTFIYLDYNIYRYFIGRPDQSVNPQSMVKNRRNHEKVLKRLISFYNTEKLSKTKKEYVKYILTYTLNTEYIIFIKIKLPDKKILNEIREFDKYLKKEAPDLYKESNEYSRSIRWNRKTNFIFAQSKKFWFSRVADFLEMRHQNRIHNKQIKENK